MPISVAASTPTTNATRPAIHPAAGRAPATPLGAALRWIDDYTSPRPETAGNLPSASYFQAAFNGAADGLYLFGLPGVAFGAASASLGVAVYNATDSCTLGVLSGALTGAACGAGLAMLRGTGTAGLLAGAVGGAMLGGYETLRGDPKATNRDANTLLSAILLSGPAKLAGSFGAMVGAHMESTGSKIAVATATGAAVGAAVAAAFPGGSSILAATLIAGATASLGPIVGPRMSQFLRNLAADLGKGLQKVGRHLGIVHKPAGSRATATIGTIPVAFVREGVRALILSDGSMIDALVGGVKESARQVHVVLTARQESAQEQPGV